jgi:hypothetical protein
VLRFLASTPRAESDDASPATRFSTRGDTVIATVGPNNGSVIVGREASSQASDANAAQTSSGRAVHRLDAPAMWCVMMPPFDSMGAGADDRDAPFGPAA